MKEIIISKARIKTEWMILLVCFLIACLANAGAVLYYKSPAIELITSIGYVVTAAVVLYIIGCLIRLTGYGIKKLFFKK
jgi:hypothetical protein